MPVEKFTIARNDQVYECFPHLCRTQSGRLLLCYRESNGHVASEFCRLIVRFSDDAGHSWSPRQILAADEGSSEPLTTWNCPKIQQLRDGRILLLCDTYDYPPGEWGDDAIHGRIVLFFSGDDGRSWSESQSTPVAGICPDQVTEMDDGRWLLPTNIRRLDTHQILQHITVSRDQGQSWEAPYVVCEDPERELDEASIVSVPDGPLVMYLRDDSGRPLQKMLSQDGGASWTGPYATRNPAAIGMPIAGLTQDGLVLTTGRFGIAGGWRPGLGPEEWSKSLDRRSVVIPRVPANQWLIERCGTGPGVRHSENEVVLAGGGAVHTFAFIEPLDSALQPDLDGQSGLLLPLDLDANPLGADSGYTGWVEYERGRFLAVNYINDDAPQAQIRAYRFGLEDF